MEKEELVEKNAFLEKELDELKEKYEKEVKRHKKNLRIYHKREERSRRIMISKTVFISVISIAASSVLTSLISNINKINVGANEIASFVQDACFYDIGYHEGSNGYTFNIGSDIVSYDSAMNTIRYRAQSNGISDVDLYIGISKIINKDVAKSVVDGIEQDDVNRRCMESYLEKEMENVSGYGR